MVSPPGPWLQFVLAAIPKHSIVRPVLKCQNPKWLIPLHWYWTKLALAGSAADLAAVPAGSVVTSGVSWIELVLDFEMSTRVLMTHHDPSKASKRDATSVKERARYFAGASRLLFKLCSDSRVPNIRVSSLLPFGSAPISGIPTRVVLLNPRHIFAELAHQALMHRTMLNCREDSGSQWSWPPYYKRLPKPMWRRVVSVDDLPVTRLHRKTTLHASVLA